jgi:hypothetical protein
MTAISAAPKSNSLQWWTDQGFHKRKDRRGDRRSIRGKLLERNMLCAAS